MKSERIEVRLDEEHVRKIAELKATYDASTSEVVRKAIDAAWEEAMLDRRLKAVQRMAEANVEDVPDMETLRRQLGRHPDYLQDDIT